MYLGPRLRGDDNRCRCYKTKMTFDTIIRGGTVATASDTFICDVGITGGKVAALGNTASCLADIVVRFAAPAAVTNN